MGPPMADVEDRRANRSRRYRMEHIGNGDGEGRHRRCSGSLTAVAAERTATSSLVLLWVAQSNPCYRLLADGYLLKTAMV